MRFRACLALTLALTGLASFGARAQTGAASDWPQWRGPDRNGHSRDTGLLKAWSEGGPRLVWKGIGLGGGYSAVAVTGGRIYGMGYRGSNEAVWCLDAATGKELWGTLIADFARVGYGQGSRSTPTVDGDRLFAIGAGGELACLKTADGSVLWKKNMPREFGAPSRNWGFTESPLVDGDRVIVTPGGAEHSMVALSRDDGRLIWKSSIAEEADSGGGRYAHYSSAIIGVLDGRKQYIQFMSRGVVGVDASDGKLLWRYQNPANGTANISTPIYSAGHVFAASGYNTGGGLVKLTAGTNGVEAQQVYFTRQMQNHHGGMVLVGEYLYGFDGSNLTCLRFLTGEVAWVDRSVGKGSLAYADGHLYARGERGAVALVEATPRAYVEKGRFEQPDRSSFNAWPHPVVAGGRLYLRDQDLLLCYDVKGGS